MRLRPARADDRGSVLEISRTIWEGRDYVPDVWDDWLADPDGRLIVAEFEERVAAFGHVVRIAPNEWWLEGLRVHEAFRQRGLATALHHRLVELWRESGGPGTLGLLTHSDNQAIHRLCERTGFTRALEITPWEAAPAAEPHGLQALQSGEADRAFALVSGTPLYAEVGGRCDLDWKYVRLTPERLAERIAAGWAYRRNDWRGVLVGYEVEPDPSDPEDESHRRLYIRFPAAAPEDLSALLRAARALAAERGKAVARWTAPLRPNLAEALEAAGYTRAWDDSMYLFEARQ